eukprot:5359596-Pyramimonas_sp.AAC.1
MWPLASLAISQSSSVVRMSLDGGDRWFMSVASKAPLGGLRNVLGDWLVLGWLDVAHGEGDEEGGVVADVAA